VPAAVTSRSAMAQGIPTMRPDRAAGQIDFLRPSRSSDRRRRLLGRPYRAIFLTDAGRRLAEEARERHRLVAAFLVSIGVSAETAHHDAEGIEHHVSDETLSAFKRFLSS
jgi:hypothetical protein